MMSEKCFICGKRIDIYKKSNYSPKEMSSYSFSSRKIPEYMHWDLYECKNCHILYAKCPMEKESIFKEYEQADYDSTKEACYASETYYKYLLKKAPDFQKEDALDIGTGNGSYLLMLKEGGVKNVVGVEPSRSPIEAADTRVKSTIINAPFSAELFENESFDMISLFQTIEHIPNTKSTIRDIKKILKPSGLFYVVCHDYLSPVNRILGFRSPIYDIEHLQIFSKKSIYRLMKKAGFTNIKVFQNVESFKC